MRATCNGGERHLEDERKKREKQNKITWNTKYEKKEMCKSRNVGENQSRYVKIVIKSLK